MSECKYTKSDVDITYELYKIRQNKNIQERIKNLREQMDLYDDWAMRNHIAQKIVRLRSELINK